MQNQKDHLINDRHENVKTLNFYFVNKIPIYKVGMAIAKQLQLSTIFNGTG
jgi:hypothetical protein